MHDTSPRLVIREDQAVSKHHVLPPASRKHHNFCNVVRCEGVYTLVNFLRLGSIAVEPDHTELGLDLTRVDLHNPHAGGNEFLAHSVGETTYGGLGRTVYASTCVWLAACDAANVDDVAAVTLLHARQNELSHCYQTSHVGGEHGVDVFWNNGAGLCHAFDQAAETCQLLFLPDGLV